MGKLVASRRAAAAVFVYGFLPAAAGFAVVAGCDGGSTSTARASPAASALRGVLPVGAYGELHWHRIVLTPPESAIGALLERADAVAWSFEGMDTERFVGFIAGLDLTEEQLEVLAGAASADAARSRVVVRPPRELVVGLSPGARSTIYQRLAPDPSNPSQLNALRYWASSPEQWFDEVGLPHEARVAAQRFAYPHGAFQAIADVRGAAPEGPGRERAVRLLASEATVALSLQVRGESEVEGLVRYWGVGGREDAVRPLIRAAAASGAPLDVRLLLPEFAARRLYCYPDARDGAALEGGSRDCHWSAMNFFNASPDDTLGEAEAVARAMDEVYEPAEGEPRLGDLVVLMRDGEAFHSAVHVAGDIVFTRNGTRPTRPWMLLPLPVMLDFYPGESPVEVVRLRLRPRTAGRGGAVGEADRSGVA